MIVSLLLSVREYRRYLKSYRAVGAIQPQLSGFHSEKDSELSDTEIVSRFFRKFNSCRSAEGS